MNERMNRRVLNRVIICIDDYEEDISGRLFTQYKQSPVEISNSMQMFREMNNLYDSINIPQSSVRIREFHKAKKADIEDEAYTDVVVSSEKLLEQRGKKATFAVDVTTRQNATWQGVVCWLEENIVKEFQSFRELLALIDAAVK